MNDMHIIALSNGRFECHPLFNSVVLDNIIKCSDVSSLKEMRIVCKFWYKKTTPHLQQRAYVKLKNIDNLDPFIEYIENIPYNEIFYRHYNIEICHNINHKYIERFFQKCCPTMISLTFHSSIISVEFLNKLWFKWSPELKHISFEDCSFIPSSSCNENFQFQEFICNKLTSLHYYSTINNANNNIEDEENIVLEQKYIFPFKWIDIFKSFPNLKILSLNDLSEEENIELLMSLKEISQNCSHDIQLEKVDIFGHKKYSIRSVSYKVWDLLSKVHLQYLTVLIMDIGMNVNEFVFGKALANFASTLEKLQIWRGRIGGQLCGFPYDIKFPRLKILELPENCVNGFQFINYMRNLERLIITQCDTHPNLEEETTIFNNINMDKIYPLGTLTYIYVEFYMNDVSKLEKLFPNVLNINMVGDIPNSNDFNDDEPDDEYENNNKSPEEWKGCIESILKVGCMDV